MVMTDEARKKHEHGGKSSRGILNAVKVIDAIDPVEGSIFLDVGCGEGHFSFAAAEKVGRKGKVYALDMDEEGLASLRDTVREKGIENIEVISGDATEKIPLDGHIVDICFMANVLHGFVANSVLEPVISEILRIMKPAGSLAVVEFKKGFGVPGPPRSVRLSPEETEKVLIQYGFEKERVLNVGLFNYMILLKRKIDGI
jgi:ubiquinone/menaquinone biosynthesis C-methylase UbiE